MKRKLIAFSAICFFAAALTGCEPSARSMGATLMPAPIQHKATKTDSSNVSLSTSGVWGHTGDAYNVKDLNAFGGNFDLTYRVGRSPLFVSAAFGGFGGSLNFGCDEDYDCSAEHGDRGVEVIVGGARNYRNWLESKPGKDDYSFWNIQERVLTGIDFNPGPIILGLAGGLQMFQGGGDYDAMRDELDSKYIVDDIDGSSGMGFAMAYWFGFRLGPNGGGWGNLVMEYDILHKGGMDDWTYSLKFSYAHPMGIFAGVGSNSLIAWTVYAGKRFDF